MNDEGEEGRRGDGELRSCMRDRERTARAEIFEFNFHWHPSLQACSFGGHPFP